MRRMLKNSSRFTTAIILALGAGLAALPAPGGDAAAWAQAPLKQAPLKQAPLKQAPLGRHQTLHPNTGTAASHLISNLPQAQLIRPDALRYARSYSGTKIDVTNYHYDNYRTGWNPSETDLTPASVASANFGLLKSLAVDGNVFAEPLLVSNFTMPDNTVHDVLIIATGHDTVYAFDAQSYAQLWKVSLGKSQSTNDVGCGDVQPEYGISSTPVILRSGAGSAKIYLVAATEPTPFAFHTQLHALDLGTGSDSVPPVEISPSATLADGSSLHFDPQNQWSRASLAYGNGTLYIGIGSHCDNNAGGISGWLLRYGTDLTLQKAFNTIMTPAGYELSSIWMGGFAPALDAKGNIFVVTGNGDRTPGAKNWGESVLRLPPDLSHVANSFTPNSFRTLNNNDTDFGSGGVMLLPPVSGQAAPPMAVAIGKASILYLLNTNALGGLKAQNHGALQTVFPGGNGIWGGPAYYNGASGPTVFVQTDGDVLHAFSLNTSATPSLSLVASGTTSAGYGGSLPIISSNGATPNTGVVWLIRRSNPIQLEAYDAANLGAPLYAATAGGPWSNTGNNNPFLSPMEANGRVYVAGYKTVKVFGLIK